MHVYHVSISEVINYSSHLKLVDLGVEIRLDPLVVKNGHLDFGGISERRNSRQVASYHKLPYNKKKVGFKHVLI